MRLSRIVVCVCALASFGLADVVNYTEDGIDFTLDVDDSTAGMVTAVLTMKTTNYVGNATDALHATGFKIFSSDQVANATLVAAPGPETDWFLKAGGAIDTTVHPSNNTTAPNAGFVTIIFDDPLGPAMDGSTYTFEVKFNNAPAVIDEWSLKGITVLAGDSSMKSQQWSSGPLTPGPGGPGGVPEPAAVLLFALGAIAIASRRRR